MSSSAQHQGILVASSLARDLSGPLVRPGEASDTVARRLCDPRFDSVSPAGIAYCRSPRPVPWRCEEVDIPELLLCNMSGRSRKELLL